MSRRQTTNVKLAAIIQGKDEDLEAEEQLREEERKAKQRLQRARLYNGGARTMVPRVKKLSKTNSSPFVLSGAINDQYKELPITHSASPCAHDDQYRIVRNPTRLSENDADRSCINSSTMKEGLHVVSQPPWYVGYNNNIIPSDTSYTLAALRYGFRGAVGIHQFNTKPYEVPSKTRTMNTPKFLTADSNFVDEYVPPIFAATQQTINCLETPKLWPENAEYVQGYKKKKLPTSWIYKRETTVDQPQLPQSPNKLTAVMSKISDEIGLLRDNAKQETMRVSQSNAMLALSKFESQWRDTVRNKATSSLKVDLNKVHTPFEPHTLLDPSDLIKYSGSTAMIVHTQTTEELKFRMRMQQTTDRVNTPFEMRWNIVIMVFNHLRKKLRRNQTMEEIIDKLGECLHAVAIRNGSETSIRRADFVHACSRITFLEDVSSKQISQIYSAFDYMKKNAMRYVEFLLCLIILNQPKQPALPKLQHLYSVYNTYGLDRSVFDICYDILCSCAASIQDISHIQEYFKGEFRQNAYELAIKRNFDDKNLPPMRHHINNNEDEEQVTDGELLTDNYDDNLDYTGNSQNKKATHDSRTTSRAQTPLKSSKSSDAGNTMKKTAFVQSQYNICEQFITEDTFVKVVENSPQLLQEFDEQLSGRLLLCYGRDEHNKEPEKEVELVQNLDFAWILKKEAPKREVFGLY